MKRRGFIVLLGGLASLPQIAFAQSTDRMRLMGWLAPLEPNDPLGLKVRAAFDKQIRDLRWVEGQNLQIERRWARGDPERANELAKELVELGPDVILASTSLSVAALVRQTRTIPIVFAGVTFPIEQGYIANMARPGGNLTGVSLFAPESLLKEFQLLSDLVPGATIPRFVSEVDALRRHLSLERIMLLGQSWGSAIDGMVEEIITGLRLAADETA